MIHVLLVRDHSQLVSHLDLKCMRSSSASTVRAVSRALCATVLHGG